MFAEISSESPSAPSLVLAIATTTYTGWATCSNGSSLISGACYGAENTDSGPGNYAFYGLDGSGTPGGVAVEGYTTYGFGVIGYSNGAGVGVQGSSVTGPAVVGLAGSGAAAVGSNEYGVYGASAGSDGVHGETSSAGSSGVAGISTASNGNGVYGKVTGSASGGSLSALYGHDEATGGTSQALYLSDTASGTTSYGIFVDASTATTTTTYAGWFHGDVHVTGALTCGSGCSSDERLKMNVASLAGKSALDQLLRLRGVTFEWKDPKQHQNHTGPQTGVVAQEVEKVFPQWVGENEGFKTVDPDARAMVGLTVEAFRELKTQNDELRAERKTDRATLLELKDSWTSSNTDAIP